MKTQLVFLLLGLVLSGGVWAQTGKPYTTAEALEYALGVRSTRTRPLILAHRGGPEATETENSLETFRHMYRQVPEAILEMDVRMTSDSILVLLHDDDVARTTTGTGSLGQMPWVRARQLFLRDLNGKPTSQRIARFDDVLHWGSGRVLMAIDAKPGVDLLRVMNAIAKADALQSVFVICYSTNDALLIRQYYPDCWIALGFTDPSHINELKQAGLSVRHLIALASKQTPDFYQQLHAAGIACTVGTYGKDNLDSRPLSEVTQTYRELVTLGADIITTDRPAEVATLYK